MIGLARDAEALTAGKETETLRFVDAASLDPKVLVPTYYDRRFDEAFDDAMATPQVLGFSGRLSEGSEEPGPNRDSRRSRLAVGKSARRNISVHQSF